MIEIDTQQLHNLQKIELTMLSELDRICKKYRISYSLAAGSLLGAIRHKGFIPWDDDVDIMLIRREYMRLKEAVIQENGILYWVDYLDNPGYAYPYAKIMLKDTKMREINLRYSSAPDGIFIDVFPIETTTTDFRKRKQQYNKIQNLKGMLLVRDNYYFGQTGIRELYRKLRRIVLMSIPRKSIVNAIEKELLKYSKEKKYIYSCLTGNVGVEKAGFDPKWFEKYTSTMYDGIKVDIIDGSKQMLALQYGDYNKLPPVEQQKAHHWVDEIDMGRYI